MPLQPLKKRAALGIARHRDTAFVKRLALVANSIGRAYENDNSDPATNGEQLVLERLRQCQLRTLFDVGAHTGDWTQMALRSHPRARVHSFEILPSANSRLETRFGTDNRVVLNQFGLADLARTFQASTPEGHAQMTSLLLHPGPERKIAFECRVDTGDAYIESRGIGHVDFLKVDVEGYDLRVLRGFADTIARGAVSAIQFEFTMWAAVARTFLADFYDLLDPAGFRVGKIFPTHVEWRPYAPNMEVFVRANYLAVHESRPDLVAALTA